MRGEDQPNADRSMSAQVRSASANAPAIWAGRSNPRRAPTGERRTNRTTIGTATMPTGRLSRKMLRQPSEATIAPPNSGPQAPAMAVSALQTPIACARSFACG